MPGSAMSAFLAPSARASAFSHRRPDEGTSTRTSSPSAWQTRVLKTRSAGTPNLSAASSPYDSAAGSWSYGCCVKATPSRSRSRMAGVMRSEQLRDRLVVLDQFHQLRRGAARYPQRANVEQVVHDRREQVRRRVGRRGRLRVLAVALADH